MAIEPEEAAAGAPEAKRGLLDKVLGFIERAGNKVPHPAIIFAGLCGLVIVLSAVLAAFNVKVTYQVAEAPPIPIEEDYVGGSVVPEPQIPPNDYEEEDLKIETHSAEIKSLLNKEGVRFIFTSFVSNFASFSVVAVVFVAMIGVGVAEEAGLMAALIRMLVKVSPPATLCFIIVFVGGLSSVATDAGYLILIPLGAAAFLSVKRHPIAGIAAAYAGVSAGFAVNALITPLDSLLTEVTNEAIHIADPNKSIDLTANLYFAAASTVFVALVITLIAQKITEPRLGPYTGTYAAVDTEDVPAGEPRGLRFALVGFLAATAVITLLTVLPDAPLRNPVTGSIFNQSPLMDSLIFIISLLFLVAGICFGVGAGTITKSVDVINGIVKTFSGLAGLIFLLLLISQFIAYFNFSNMPVVAAVKMADFLERRDIGPLWLLIGFIFVIVLLDIIIPGSLPKWAIFAPVFVPLFLRLDVAPQTVLAAYRLGDSPANVITPLMVYLPFIVLVAQRYEKDAGIGTIIAMMIPYTVIVLVTWMIFFVAWYLLGIPLGPGSPIHL
ncbi:MAG TPA: AbgT family transporter [Acidimicrobiales bacterium]|nr:AbgT family transporter [Acidimicrobiales bacterium]